MALRSVLPAYQTNFVRINTNLRAQGNTTRLYHLHYQSSSVILLGVITSTEHDLNFHLDLWQITNTSFT